MSTPDKDIRFSITAEDRFARTFANLKRDMSGARDQAAGLAAGVARLGPLMAAVLPAAAGAGFVSMFKRLTDDLDAFNDAADATGSTIEKLSALDRVARENGESLDSLVSLTMRLNKVLSEAEPDSAMAQQLRRIGLDAAELARLDPADAVQQVAVALSGYAADGDRARLVQELFGKSAAQMAPLLNDLAGAGALNARVTSEQAAQADQFNKQLFRLQANVTDAARSLTAKLLPALNQSFLVLRELSAGPGLGAALFEVFKGNSFATAQAGLDSYNKKIAGLDAQLRALRNDKRPLVSANSAADIAALERQRAELDKFATAYRNIVNAGSAGAGRGALAAGLPGAPSVGQPPIKTDKTGSGASQASAQVSEAERYLETLAKQADRLQELTTLQQLESDIQNRRIDGLTPKLENELRLAAQKVDLQRQMNAEAEKEAGFQRLLTGKDQRDIDEVQRLLSATKGGQLEGLESQAEKLLAFSRRIGEDDPRQQQVQDAMRKLREEAEKLKTEPVDDAASAYDKLADSIEKSMERSTAAVLDFVISGKGSVKDLGRAFAYDILRSLVEEPVRKVMKNVAAEIAAVFKGGGAGGGAGGIWENLVRIFSGGGGGGGGLAGLFGGFTARAGGGGVGAGDLVRWRENGTEWFVPGQDGTVLTQAQLRNMGGGVTMNVTNIIQGANDPAAVQRQIDAAMARAEARMARQQRYNPAY